MKISKEHIPLELALFVVAFALALLPQIALPVPSGGDPGHYLAQGRTFPNALAYVPTVPFLASLFAEGAETASFLPIKIFSSLLFAFLALTAYFLARAASSSTRVALMTFTLVAFSALQLESIAWGGYPQLLGISLSLVAFVCTLRWSHGRRLVYPVLAGATIALAFLTHIPSAVFGLVGCSVYVLLTKAPRRFMGLLIMGLGTAIGILVDGILLGSLGLAPSVPLALRLDTNTAYWIFARIFGGAGLDSVAAMAGILILGTVAATQVVTRRLHQSPVLRVPVSLLAAAMSLLLLIPGQFADRLAYYLFFPLASVAALSGLALNKKRLRYLLVAGLISVYAWAGIIHFSSSLSFYGVVTDEDLEAFAWLREEGSEGDGVIVLTDFSQVHGWWLEGLTLMTPYIVTDPSWFVLQEERSRAVAGALALNGGSVVDAGKVKIVEGSPSMPANAPGVFINDGEDFFKIFSFNDALLEVNFAPAQDGNRVFVEAPYYAPAKEPVVWEITQGRVRGETEFVWDRMRATRTTLITTDAPIEVSYRFEFEEAIPHAITARFVAPDEISYTWVKSQETNWFELGATRENAEESLTLAFSAENALLERNLLVERNEWGSSEFKLEFRPIPKTGSVNLSFSLAIDGYQTETPEYYEVSTRLRQEGIRFVYLSHTYSSFVKRLVDDPNFALRREFGSALVFELAPANPPS